jgi:hypothetical protein
MGERNTSQRLVIYTTHRIPHNLQLYIQQASSPIIYSICILFLSARWGATIMEMRMKLCLGEPTAAAYEAHYDCAASTLINRGQNRPPDRHNYRP